MGRDAHEKTVDARGKPCPEPVILTRDAIRVGDADSIRILVDGDVPARNVARMAESHGWNASVETQDGLPCVVITSGGDAPDEAPDARDLSCTAARAPKVVVLVASDLLGVGDEELGRILMRAFVKTVKDIEPRPVKMIFVNSGVRLTTAGSDLVEDLRRLEESGVEVVSCGTCLDYYGLAEKLEVGRATNMFEIVSALVGADRVVRP